MSDGEASATDSQEDQSEVDVESEGEDAETEAVSAEATLDIEAAEEREESVEALREQVADQQERVEELEDLLLDLSARAAHDGGTGVCPDCHGPVVKINRWLRRPRIECTECGRNFHDY